MIGVTAKMARSPGPIPAKLATDKAAKLPDPTLFSRVRFWQAEQMNLSGFDTQWEWCWRPHTQQEAYCRAPMTPLHFTDLSMARLTCSRPKQTLHSGQNWVRFQALKSKEKQTLLNRYLCLGRFSGKMLKLQPLNSRVRSLCDTFNNRLCARM